MKGRTLLLLAGISAAAFAGLTAAQADNAPATPPAYKVVGGNKVDGNTLQGWKTWRALDCERCHGAQQQGLVGPSLVDAFKTLDPNEFHRTVFGGRVDKGMPDFSSSQMMQKNWQYLYAYLKGRSDGQIKPGDLKPIDDAK
ncbi:c-type cytochrome [Paraburkholderia caballeronis]|uniref:Cytochrome C oxidase, cbb3-type, subunit III n=1 Tax=Paraburkholderia caballeronis TaxID=416943 RepID=A0A1H7LPF3_9BURK|nr:c-type cytochrome [Paraburkholderia caballeronis]PXW28545.1 cbb3-type cytochrome c oxidase subunit III [Paraburkholderia caballeronis]PXX03911.1 cbb3-type cytochrome c oxidase subunit III [Paraburkholderia caballeronis]RAK04655.1 cbb3-type cytochrome c oxidase subunit III [Paraburkholderia caballeronis]TDV19556.1 cbb3-type cytochrome c oxidase subunit III [Paraburkholderia caballeronis]TDV22156.1 cbb3-type cytochrome c oxidase subunit III [Paraburkholderia caballeronis]